MKLQIEPGDMILIKSNEWTPLGSGLNKLKTLFHCMCISSRTMVDDPGYFKLNVLIDNQLVDLTLCISFNIPDVSYEKPKPKVPVEWRAKWNEWAYDETDVRCKCIVAISPSGEQKVIYNGINPGTNEF